MAEYIERDAVHDLVRSLTKYALASPGNTRHRITVDADDVDFGVDKIPSADVATVRHGRWIDLGDNYWERGRTSTRYKCSECGRRAGQKQAKLYHYCPNCGAKMDLEG